MAAVDSSLAIFVDLGGVLLFHICGIDAFDTSISPFLRCHTAMASSRKQMERKGEAILGLLEGADCTMRATNHILLWNYSILAHFIFLEPIFICTQLISTIYSYEFLGPVSITFFFNPASVNWNATRQSSLYFQLRDLSHFMDKEFVRLIITVSVFSFFVSSFPILHLIT
jgi:hypothetical protein